ncbi:hypothetical protein LA080_009855 [Diaporthe eres]|nr:hypothetical protein LA080_009855 [Diaporthe eres]
MCLEVKYRCICGVVARTQRIACIASIAHPHEEAHQLQLHDMVLPREERATRQGLCPQIGCHQNGETSTAEAGTLAKCPGCSTPIPTDLAANDAKFLDHSLWDTHNCNVENCPLNKESAAQADETLAAMIHRMQHGPEDPVWIPEDDEEIISLFHASDNAKLIIL